VDYARHQNTYRPQAISDDTVDFATGNMPNLETMNIEYSIAAAVWKVQDSMGNRFMADLMKKYMARLKQLSVLAHQQPIDTDTYRDIQPEEVQEIIKEMKWCNPRPNDPESDDEQPPPRARMSRTSGTAAPAAPAATPPLPPKPEKTASGKRKTNKVRVCPLCHKKQSVLSRHLQVHVRRGEIAADRINAIVQVADKGEKTEKIEMYLNKKKKMV